MSLFMRLKLFSVFLGFMFLVSCSSGESNKLEENTEAELSLPSDFEEFYINFHKDSIFQIEHIIFPLKGKNTKIDSVQTTSFDVEFTSENWVLHKPFIESDGMDQRFSVMSNLIIEYIQGPMGMFNVERRWAKIDSVWYLIYYETIERQWQ